MTMTQSLLDFILNLLTDSDAKAAFIANPERALADAGLSDVCSEDVSDAMSYVAEYHPVTFVGPREYNVGNGAVAQDITRHDHDGHHGDWHPDPHATAVEKLEYITNNYSYSDSHDTVDSHNTLIDKSVNESIWNKGTLVQGFDDHSVTATDHSVAAGRDIDGNVANGDGNVVGEGNSVGNSWDNHSDDHSIHGSFNGNNIADHGGVAGDGAAGNVTNPTNSAVATNGSEQDASTHDSHDKVIVKDSYNDSHDRDSHDQDSHDHVRVDSHVDDSHHTNINSGNEDSFNHHNLNHNDESFNEHSAISHNQQEGLINANVNPNVDADHLHLL
jgi:hypothetical protein